MKILPTYTKRDISPEELEETSERFLQEMFNDELRRKWSQKLAQEQHLERKGTSRKIRILWMAGIAASLLLGIVTWQFLSESVSSKKELVAMYLEDYVVNDETRKGGAGDELLRQESIEAYNREDFVQAAILRQQVVDRDSAVTKADLYYLGLSYLYQEPPQAQKAIPILEKSSQLPGRRFALEGQWYLALAYIVNNEDDKARPILEQLIDLQQWKAEEAAALLQLLDSQ